MRKIRTLIPMVLLFLLLVALINSQDIKPYSYSFEKGTGICIYQDITLEKCWSAAMNVLMKEHFKVKNVERESGILIAEKKSGMPPWYVIHLFFEEGEGTVSVSCFCERAYAKGGLEAILEKKTDPHDKSFQPYIKKFFEKVAEILYQIK